MTMQNLQTSLPGMDWELARRQNSIENLRAFLAHRGYLELSRQAQTIYGLLHPLDDCQLESVSGGEKYDFDSESGYLSSGYYEIVYRAVRVYNRNQRVIGTAAKGDTFYSDGLLYCDNSFQKIRYQGQDGFVYPLELKYSHA